MNTLREAGENGDNRDNINSILLEFKIRECSTIKPQQWYKLITYRHIHLQFQSVGFDCEMVYNILYI